jgi:acyl-CoA synthetase (AMP-forming)/AMP-acid ligase II
MARVRWREWTLVHLVRRQAAEQGDRPFVRFEDGQAFTFRSLDAWTDELAGSLAALGVRAGDRVLGLVGNRAESNGMLFAAVKLGALWGPVNTDRDRDHRLRLMMAVPSAEEWGAAFEKRFGGCPSCRGSA